MTKGQKLLLERRRQELTQANMALVYGVPHGVYGRWERDLPTPGHKAPNIRLVALQKHEQCLVARLQRGWTQQQLSEASGYCKHWISLMERGVVHPTPLVQFWGL